MPATKTSSTKTTTQKTRTRKAIAPKVAATSKPGESGTKRPSKRAPVTSSKDVPPSISAEERQRLVERAAYFRAEKRGFAPGFELQDWIEAEAEVLRLIGTP